MTIDDILFVLIMLGIIAVIVLSTIISIEQSNLYMKDLYGKEYENEKEKGIHR